jgi:hypothetical protein
VDRRRHQFSVFRRLQRIEALNSRLLCVPPEQVREVWPHVEPLLRSAIARTGLNAFRDIEADILGGKSLVWLAWSGEKIEAAASTALQQTDAGKVCVITACGGTDRRRWLPLLKQIEGYGIDEGCTATRIFGREGWLRVLNGYRPIGAIMDKALVNHRLTFP